jgi:intracellular septation protein A
VARHAGRNLLEATFAPLAIFYVALWTVGVWGALWAALAWTWGAVAVRSATGRRVPGILVLGAVGLAVRTGLAMASGSVFVYFLQPTLSALAIGLAFFVSVVIGKPLICRLAGDFCPVPDEAMARPSVQRLFNRLSLLWGAINILNAVLAIWLLTSQPVETFLWTKTVMSLTLTGFATLITVTSATRLARAEGFMPERTTIIVAEPALVFAA